MEGKGSAQFGRCFPKIFGRLELIREIEAQGVELHLTGSHFFGGKPPADADFFTQGCPKSYGALIGLGFEDISNPYQDSGVRNVLRHVCLGMDVQLVFDIEERLAVQSCLHDSGLIRRLNAFEGSLGRGFKEILNEVHTAAWDAVTSMHGRLKAPSKMAQEVETDEHGEEG